MATEPAEIAAMLRELVDVLLPGNGRFPAASDAGTHGVVADRLVAQLGETALDDLAHGPSRPAAGRLGHWAQRSGRTSCGASRQTTRSSSRRCA